MRKSFSDHSIVKERPGSLGDLLSGGPHSAGILILRPVLLMLVTALLFSACTLIKPHRYYGNYSRSYYNAVKRQDAASKQKLMESLERVFARSAEYGIAVPPGLYADYGLLLVDSNRAEEARHYFELEKAAWSGSAKFMDLLMRRYQLEY